MTYTPASSAAAKSPGVGIPPARRAGIENAGDSCTG
jgi:hypothetical protein